MRGLCAGVAREAVEEEGLACAVHAGDRNHAEWGGDSAQQLGALVHHHPLAIDQPDEGHGPHTRDGPAPSKNSCPHGAQVSRPVTTALKFLPHADTHNTRKHST